MVFEIINNFIENLFISYFVAEYLNLENNKSIFLIITVTINTLISTVLTDMNVIGIIQTLLIQCVVCLSLYKCNKNFSVQDIAISLLGNILLFIADYFSILLLSIFYDVIPINIYMTNELYIYDVLLSKYVFFLLIVIISMKKPLYFIKREIKDLEYVLTFEILIIFSMLFYLLTIILSENYNFMYSLMFPFFIVILFLFGYIFNRIIVMNQKIYENKLEKEQNHYKYENLKNLKSIKMNVDNTEHRMNYILQSIKFDIQDKKYESAMQKINSSLELVHEISPIMCTNNELFDFMLNLEIKYYLQNKKEIKVCVLISQNEVYNDLELIHHIIDTLKLIYECVNKVELFVNENEERMLQVRFITYDIDGILKDNMDNITKNIEGINIKVQEMDNTLLVLSYEEDLYEYM